MTTEFKPKITIFHCINSFQESAPVAGEGDVDITYVKMACSSMVKDVFLLRAFEAGADGVIVLVCPEGACRYVEGNIRAKKRVAWVKALLDEIGLDGGRLSIFNTKAGDTDAVEGILRQTLSGITALGPNPAA